MFAHFAHLVALIQFSVTLSYIWKTKSNLHNVLVYIGLQMNW